MAGNWIPFDESLPTKREVVLISSRCKRDKNGTNVPMQTGHVSPNEGDINRTVITLLKFWCWASNETDDGFLEGMRLADLEVLLGIDMSFWNALVDVGWLVVEDGGLLIPNADTWITRGAKARLKEARKKRNQRSQISKSENVPIEKGHLSRLQRDKNGTTGHNIIGHNIREEEIPKTQEEISLRSISSSSEVSGQLSSDHPIQASSAISGDSNPTSEHSVDQVVLTFPVVGNPNEWHLTESIMLSFEDAYSPTVDVRFECRRALEWVKSSPRNKKTAGGMRKFLNAWLGRAADRPKAQTSSSGAFSSSSFHTPIRRGQLNEGKIPGENDVY